jgi:hypothetical protein
VPRGVNFSLLWDPWERHVVPQIDPKREVHSEEGRRRSVRSSVLIWTVRGEVRIRPRERKLHGHDQELR